MLSSIPRFLILSIRKEKEDEVCLELAWLGLMVDDADMLICLSVISLERATRSRRARCIDARAVFSLELHRSVLL